MKYSFYVKTKKKPTPRLIEFSTVNNNNDLLIMHSKTIEIRITKHSLNRLLENNYCLTPKDCIVFNENGIDQILTKYERLALQWAEKYGIIEYKVKRSKMIFYINYKEWHPETRHKRNYKGETYKCVVDLKTGIETRTLLKRYIKEGWNNR